MGSSENSICEWIELHNTDAQGVSLSGWSLKIWNKSVSSSDASTPPSTVIIFDESHSVAAHGYFVVERKPTATCLDAATGVNDFSSQSFSITDAEATLELEDASGNTMDYISNGGNWEENIGGEKETKKTPQHTAAGWKTASPTPGRGLTATEVEEAEEEETVSDTQESADTDQKNVAIELQLPKVMLGLELLVPDVAYVDQNVVFDAEATGLGETALDSLEFTWNYGDLSTGGGKRTAHAYAYPGEYVVTLHASFARHEQVSRKTIKVLPVAFSISRNSKGDVLILNNAKYEVNISGFQLKGKEKVVFPPRSIILANGTITIPKEKLGSNSFTPITLFNQNGQLLASSFQAQTIVQKTPLALPFEESALEKRTNPKNAELSVEDAMSGATSSNFSFAGKVTDTKQATETAKAGEFQDSLALLSDIDVTEGIPKGDLPLLGLAGIVTLGIMAIFLGRRRDTE
jgi:hypothetical protein